jgi:hypothetical protein
MPRERTKIRSDNVRDEILKELRKNKRMRTAEIHERMQPIAERVQLKYRPRAVSECLTALKREGMASNDSRGTWEISENGMSK